MHTFQQFDKYRLALLNKCFRLRKIDLSSKVNYQWIKSSYCKVEKLAFAKSSYLLFTNVAPTQVATCFIEKEEPWPWPCQKQQNYFIKLQE